MEAKRNAEVSKIEFEKLISVILMTWPDLIPRTSITKLSGGLINSRTLANRMSLLGDGPPFVRCRGKVAFNKSSFIEWLRKSYLKDID